jgi:hypothetical protein
MAPRRSRSKRLRVVAEPPSQAFRGLLLRLISGEGSRLLHIDEETEAREADEAERDAARWAQLAAERTLEAERRAREATAADVARPRKLLDRAEQALRP